MRISDWSSDVCSSDLVSASPGAPGPLGRSSPARSISSLLDRRKHRLPHVLTEWQAVSCTSAVHLINAPFRQIFSLNQKIILCQTCIPSDKEIGRAHV